MAEMVGAWQKSRGGEQAVSVGFIKEVGDAIGPQYGGPVIMRAHRQCGNVEVMGVQVSR